MNTTHDPSPDHAGLPAIIPPLRGVVQVPTAAKAPSTAPDAMALLKALRRRWRMATSLGLLAAGVVAAVAYFVTPPAKYKAQAMLHVATYQPKVLLDTNEARADYKTYQRTQEAMIKSRLVLNTALKQPEVAALKVIRKQVDPVEWLEKEIKVEYAPGSEILHIAMNGDDAREPTVLVDAVTRAYMDEIVNVEVKQRQEHQEMLRRIWRQYQDFLRGKRDEVRRLAEAAGSNDKQALAIIHQSEQERLSRAEDDLARTKSELRSLQVEAAVLKKQADLASAAVSPAVVEDQVARDRGVEVLSERLAEARSNLARAEARVRNKGDIAADAHRRNVASLKASLEARCARLRPIIEAQLVARSGGEAREKAAMIQERIRVLSGLEEVLGDDVNRLATHAREITRSSVDLASINEEIGAADSISKKVGDEVEILNVELKAPPRVRLIEAAELPRTKDESRQAKVAGLAGLGAFVAMLAGVSFWESRARRIGSPDEVVRGLGMRVVGTLPALPERRGRPRGVRREQQEQRWQSLLVESIDAARTALLHAARTESMRVVMIASAMSGEGKTSLACHLATSLARAGRRTLLVDGDLRRPSVHRLFDLPDGPGLCEVLRGEVGLADAIQPAPAGNLSVIPAGLCDSAAIHALARDDIRSILARLREQFDFVILDSSPVLPVADALLIGQHVDAVLVSIMRDISRAPKVFDACERFTALGIRMLGAVVTGTQSELYGNEYHYAYASRSHDRD